MDDDRRKRVELGSAPTTPGPRESGPGVAGLAAGSGPDSTIAMSAVSTQAATDNEPGPGSVIGHFIVRKRLGAGGMGVVLACDDADLGRPVALKLVRDDNPAYRARLLREAQAMARLEHTNVVKVHEVGSDRGRVFIAMELVDGETLTSWLAVKRPWREVVDMFLQIASGLAAAHAVGLVHRDFKPDNVLIDRQGRARVADFGLARFDEEAETSKGLGPTLTRTGVVMGTPGYMAPEQNFDSHVDARADEYSFCVALREGLAGRPLDDARWKVVPEHVRSVVLRGLSYDPSDRFASMTELVAALVMPASPAATPVREPRWIVALLVLAVLGSVAGVVAYVGTRKSQPQAAAVPRDAQAFAVAADAESPIAVIEDAGVHVAAPPVPPDEAIVRDASVAIRAPRDAGVRVAKAAAQPAVVSPDAAVASAPPNLPVIAPTSKGWPAAKVGDPAHMPAVRTAIKGLGYDGFDAGWTAPDLKAVVDAASGADRAIAQVKLGIVERRRGKCAVATPLFVDAIGVLKPEPEEQAQWAARAWMGRALCSLAAGNTADADEEIKRVWVHGDRQEVQLIMGFIAYEKGEKDIAYAHLLTAERMKKPSVQAALQLWLDGQGLTLR